MKVERAGVRGAPEPAEEKGERFGKEMERAQGKGRARLAGVVAAGAEGGVGARGDVAVRGGVGERSTIALPGEEEGHGLGAGGATRVAISVRVGPGADVQRVEIAAGERIACALEQGPRGVEIQVCAAPAILAAARADLQAVTAELRRRGVRVARAELRARERSGRDRTISPEGLTAGWRVDGIPGGR